MELAKYAFRCEWVNAPSFETPEFILSYQPDGNFIEMITFKEKRSFLKKTQITDIKLSDLFVGNVVNILGRLLRLTDYGNDFSRRELMKSSERVIVAILRNGIQHLNRIITKLEETNILVINLKMSLINNNLARSLCYLLKLDYNETFGWINLSEHEPVIFIEFMGCNVREKVSTLMNRDIFALTLCHAHENGNGNQNSINIFKNQELGVYPHLQHTTLLLVKPHILSEGVLGNLLETIKFNGFEIVCAQTIRMNLNNAQEFLEVYKGVLPNFIEYSQEYASGTSLALELARVENVDCLNTSELLMRQEGNLDIRSCMSDYDPNNNPVFEDELAIKCHHMLRELCGPLSPKIRQNTIRSKFGRNDVKNAVHCTDLVDDIRSELEFAFVVFNCKRT